MPHKRKDAKKDRRQDLQQTRIRIQRPRKNWANIQEADETRGVHPLNKHEDLNHGTDVDAEPEPKNRGYNAAPDPKLEDHNHGRHRPREPGPDLPRREIAPLFRGPQEERPPGLLQISLPLYGSRPHHRPYKGLVQKNCESITARNTDLRRILSEKDDYRDDSQYDNQVVIIAANRGDTIMLLAEDGSTATTKVVTSVDDKIRARKRDDAAYDYMKSDEHFTPELQAVDSVEDGKFRRFIESSGQSCYYGFRFPLSENIGNFWSKERRNLLTAWKERMEKLRFKRRNADRERNGRSFRLSPKARTVDLLDEDLINVDDTGTIVMYPEFYIPDDVIWNRNELTLILDHGDVFVGPFFWCAYNWAGRIFHLRMDAEGGTFLQGKKLRFYGYPVPGVFYQNIAGENFGFQDHNGHIGMQNESKKKMENILSKTDTSIVTLPREAPFRLF